ncbi:MAG: lipocalin family protein [Thermoanaerobaculia bacterium]|jgi:hypothetical protein
MSLRKTLAAVVLGLVALGASPRSVDVERLKGAWFGDGPSFEMVVRDRTILFEFDMKEHAYRIDGDVLIISYDDGEQRHRIIRLTDDEMEWESEATATRSVLHRTGAWERASAPRAQPNVVARSTTRGWPTFRNEKYGYEIQHPERVEVRETGREPDRDGATIRLVFKEYEAPTPALDIRIVPRTPETKFPRLGTNAPGMTLSIDDVVVGGEEARLAQYRWQASGDLAFAELFLRGIVFSFDANSGVRDIRETQWWEMISTFRIRKAR